MRGRRSSGLQGRSLLMAALACCCTLHRAGSQERFKGLLPGSETPGTHFQKLFCLVFKNCKIIQDVAKLYKIVYREVHLSYSLFY